MGKRLYVGNLPYDADESMLREAFAQDGRVVERVHIVIDRETQRPRGFAFVEMATEEQARSAMEAMNGATIGLRQIRVTEAEDRRPAGPGGAGGPGPRGPSGPPRTGGFGGGGYSGGSGGGGSGGGGPGAGAGDGSRTNRFGPDARPARERQRELDRRGGGAPKRREGGDDDSYHGRRGSRRFDDDDE